MEALLWGRLYRQPSLFSTITGWPSAIFATIHPNIGRWSFAGYSPNWAGKENSGDLTEPVNKEVEG